ncbi:phosphoenolpyruvate synthase [Candidatus Hydrogenisulfobacillus filiaventi]|uniref:Phosphoenolpyruvate synthase n=1 Tax=Candidatus Hydrogenisulfobacillus filiaventi TaxID=2707344 RepID=A0A6F8ZD07_9FIRM|nr:phosphoenolpyruvate synthase [Candidatus Hydrogenisulfobacillus filiaventi]
MQAGNKEGAAGAASPWQWIRRFREVGIGDVPLVGGKNASLGEMIRELAAAGVPVPDGFAITADAFRHYLRENAIEQPLLDLLNGVQGNDVDTLERTSRAAAELVLGGHMPADLETEILDAYRELSAEYGTDALEVAVRSSATVEDLPGASFAGAHETYLNIQGPAALLQAVKQCFASLYTPRAIRYREDMGFAHGQAALSVGVQKMLNSSEAASGVMFTLDTETGFRNVVQIDAIWGLGENIVQGRVGPDEFYVHKPTLQAGYRPLIWKKLGTKEFRLTFDRSTRRHHNRPVPKADRARFCLTDEEVLQLARWAVQVEAHYSARNGKPTPMDMEFAKDGPDGGLYIVQARPETVHSTRRTPSFEVYELEERGPVLAEGLAIGERIASGPVRVIKDPRLMDRFQPGEILVTETTNPDWEPIMRIAKAIITERGGRTSHAAIVTRELGIPAVVGVKDATRLLSDGQTVTVSCAEGEMGRIYQGALRFKVDTVDPGSLPPTRTQVMLNVANPEQAFGLALLPGDGVGLARMEFIFAEWVGIHPLALLHPDRLSPREQRQLAARIHGYPDGHAYFVDRLSQGIAVLAAAFYPRPVILRFSDFKTNEYATLLGGAVFEPKEDNPMLGWRGASRYYHPDYRDGFLLEVEAVRRVRDTMGLTNLKVMVPFCRTPEEGARVLEVMRAGGLERGQNGLEVYVMAEIPSNITLAAEFAAIFDGFSIGSNDLTQLTLGVDRDSERVAPLFNERNPAVQRACAALIHAAHDAGRKVGICGQAPSDYPDFAAFLVQEGIDSISLNPDAFLRTKRRIAEMEATLAAPS